MCSAFIFKPAKKYIFTTQPEKRAPAKGYKEARLTLVQKSFDSYRPVKPFNRFGKEKIADTGIDPSSAYLSFIKKEATQPYIKEDKVFYNENEKYIPSKPLKWTVGNTCICNDENLLPKKDPYKIYQFSKRSQEDIDKYRRNYLPTDHISIRAPNLSFSKEDKNLSPSFLQMKSEFDFNKESGSFWVPRTNDYPTQANKSSVGYNIINNQNNEFAGLKNMGIFDKSLNYKKKGIAEFSDYLKPTNYNPNQRYLECFENNKDRFHNYKGIFSELYDSSARNGNIYIPFKGDNNQNTSEKYERSMLFKRRNKSMY